MYDQINVLNLKCTIITVEVINHVSMYLNNCSSGRFEYCEIPKCTDEEIEQMDLCTDVDCGVGGDCYLNK